jgi:hypothetical protein
MTLILIDIGNIKDCCEECRLDRHLKICKLGIKRNDEIEIDGFWYYRRPVECKNLEIPVEKIPEKWHDFKLGE